MADVRSLLRNELASRKGASPNTTGNRVSKKRKVDNGEGVMRKKLRSTDIEAVQAAASAQGAGPSAEGTIEDDVLEPVEEAELEEPLDENQQTDSPTAQQIPPTPLQESFGSVDEDEWAAFEREVAAPTRMAHAPAAIAAEATISAAPVTNEELAAQQEKEKASAGRTREAELEGEREDAARFMEEEFDEMDQLEERVRRLKHMREELRQKRAEDQTRDVPMASDDQRAAESDSDEDDYEDWDDWRFK
ncbi:hypothetical protein N7448_001128 [Penicillium atrosanguineum]|uniref:Uncharacterized protein n=1 Tax=Penicillium atrosanguineum TaxID=1132637 RepID=A0A9W9Q4F8_9EURO|nr:Ribosomal RNA large subunit methyltransferase E [Penicillium atrosanguineum]KAJ5133852.1 hypothetical protein N7526_005217 [Penicillium atrosanguineum]KAJ5149550.1 hypothetical protein N7448_001128 [Penicillium atrosanguineum]KAJ5304866.1 Ribosomal RNA large subunit methyltransferase E [Penicillium atrosanguineum]KAJ5324330.1 hypothetical protein N7476_002930 [Penicillium atrosanguineum]